MSRHTPTTRVWHWVNALSAIVLFMSGLTISNAHPRLYWGEWGFAPEQAWLNVPRFADWMTIPGHYDLAVARDWHILMAWPFGLGLALYGVLLLISGRMMRDLVPGRTEWRWPAIRADLARHLRLDLGAHGAKYNFLQKLLYLCVLGALLPGLLLTGLGISPGMEPVIRPLIELAGGRQSMRSLHFLCAFSLAGFLALHVLAVLLSHPVRQMRAMTVGGPDAA